MQADLLRPGAGIDQAAIQEVRRLGRPREGVAVRGVWACPPLRALRGPIVHDPTSEGELLHAIPITQDDAGGIWDQRRGYRENGFTDGGREDSDDTKQKGFRGSYYHDANIVHDAKNNRWVNTPCP